MAGWKAHEMFKAQSGDFVLKYLNGKDSAVCLYFWAQGTGNNVRAGREGKNEGKEGNSQSLQVKTAPNKRPREVKFLSLAVLWVLHKFWGCRRGHVLYYMFSQKSQTETSHHGFERVRPPLSHVSATQSPLGPGSGSCVINHCLIDVWQRVSTPGEAAAYSMENF